MFKKLFEIKLRIIKHIDNIYKYEEQQYIVNECYVPEITGFWHNLTEDSFYNIQHGFYIEYKTYEQAKKVIDNFVAKKRNKKNKVKPKNQEIVMFVSTLEDLINDNV